MKRYLIAAFWVALFGAAGSAARFGSDLTFGPLWPYLPLGTFFVNVVGSFVIGFVGSLTAPPSQGKASQRKFPAFSLPYYIRIGILVGFCGGFTTFSSFSLDTLSLIQQGSLARPLLNIVLSVLFCLIFVKIGDWLGGNRFFRIYQPEDRI